MILLGIETCCGAYSICIRKDDVEIYYFSSTSQNQQAEELIDNLDTAFKNLMLDYQNLDVIAVTVGPGSFTGIRIGLAAIYGLSYELDVKFISVTTLEALAISRGDVDVVLPAGRGKVYFQSFANGNPLSEIQLKDVNDIDFA
jgi:tRNA threonylcarbamoyladenosine biosynthesis protein TsaB